MQALEAIDHGKYVRGEALTSAISRLLDPKIEEAYRECKKHLASKSETDEPEYIKQLYKQFAKSIEEIKDELEY